MKINNSEGLKAAILELEHRNQKEKQQLTDNFHALKESLKPVNLIKSTFHKVKETPGVSSTLLKAAVGIGVGLVSKRFLLGNSPGFLRKIVGSAIQMGLAGFAAKKTDTIKNTGNIFFKNLFASKMRKVLKPNR